MGGTPCPEQVDPPSQNMIAQICNKTDPAANIWDGYTAACLKRQSVLVAVSKLSLLEAFLHEHFMICVSRYVSSLKIWCPLLRGFPVHLPSPLAPGSRVSNLGANLSWAVALLVTRSYYGAPGLATRSKDATRGSWPYY